MLQLNWCLVQGCAHVLPSLRGKGQKSLYGRTNSDLGANNGYHGINWHLEQHPKWPIDWLLQVVLGYRSGVHQILPREWLKKKATPLNNATFLCNWFRRLQMFFYYSSPITLFSWLLLVVATEAAKYQWRVLVVQTETETNYRNGRGSHFSPYLHAQDFGSLSSRRRNRSPNDDRLYWEQKISISA